ncbi:deleted in malignant brain tumors 1 protein-like [Bolinopsis microptera]|uniref:deleted in malignant brain tumors 1 protein-like n=1 Tax=Bolinopsis microptera TaxID=2820187 RepID=UPI00307A2499
MTIVVTQKTCFYNVKELSTEVTQILENGQNVQFIVEKVPKPEQGLAPTLLRLMVVQIVLGKHVMFSLVDLNGDTVGAGVEGLLLSNEGTVCDDAFTDNSADAICREMGHIGQMSWSSNEKWGIQEGIEITLDDVACSSGEWSSCSYSTSANCRHDEDVFLQCEGVVFSLVDLNGDTVGAGVEGLLLSNEGTVCDDAFTDNSADAICREMGYIGQMSWSSGNRLENIQEGLEITLDDVDCSSGEWSSCSFSFDDNCGHGEDVFLQCEGVVFSLVDLNGNTVGAGVEGLLLSNEGTVCDDAFTDNSADAICREMGYIGQMSWSSVYGV